MFEEIIPNPPRKIPLGGLHAGWTRVWEAIVRLGRRGAARAFAGQLSHPDVLVRPVSSGARHGER